MITLVCAEVNVAGGSAFPVDIDKGKLVGHLKDEIAEKQKYEFAASKLQLFLAKTEGGAWLALDDAASVDIDRDGDARHSNTKLVKMEPLQLLKTCVGKLPKQIQVHVLVVLPEKELEADSRYFIQPNVQDQVEKAVFVIVDEDNEELKGVGMGVFFSATLAVTCDHNLTAQHTVGNVVTLALKDEKAEVVVVARDAELDFAILQSSKPRPVFIPPWNGRPDALRGRYDLVLASYRLGIDEYQDVFKNQLGFAQVAGISLSAHRRHIMYSCPTYAGDSGAALLIKDGFLVGIHVETINALREEMDRKKTMKGRLTDVEESLDNIARSGLAQGCSGLLVHAFKDVVRE